MFKRRFRKDLYGWHLIEELKGMESYSLHRNRSLAVARFLKDAKPGDEFTLILEKEEDSG